MMMAAILNSTTLDSAILHKKLHSFILTHLDDGSHLELCLQTNQPFWFKKKRHSLILTHCDNGSHLEFYHLGFSHFAQKKLYSFHSHSTWWWQPFWILLCWIQTLPSWIQPFCTKLWLKLIQSDSNSFVLTQLDDVSHLEFYFLLVSHFEQIKTSLIHSDSTWWCHPSVNSPYPLDSAILHKLWLKLIQSDWNSFTLTQLDDVRHLVFCHLGFRHFEQIKTSLIHSHSTWGCQPSWILHSSSQLFWTKKTSLIHSDSTWWWQPSSILPSWIQPFCIKKLHSFILSHLDDGSHLEFYHLGFSHFEQKKLGVIHSALNSDSMANSILKSNSCWIWPFCFHDILVLPS